MGDNSSSSGEGSVSPEERDIEATKVCENDAMHVENEAVGKKEDEEKGDGEEGSFFDCNICLDLARDPIVTCCGHLFCWPCLYRWLHVRSDSKECPVCKGGVTIKTVTPIYGLGNDTRKPEEDPSLKIPLRPHARRIDRRRLTFQRNSSTIPIEETILFLGRRNRREQSRVVPPPPDDVVDIEEDVSAAAAEAASGDEGGSADDATPEAEMSLQEEMHQLVEDLASETRGVRADVDRVRDDVAGLAREMRGGFRRQRLEMAEVRADVARVGDDVVQIRGDLAAVRESLERGDLVAVGALLERYA